MQNPQTGEREGMKRIVRGTLTDAIRAQEEMRELLRKGSSRRGRNGFAWATTRSGGSA
jgi:hypothetical protein